MKHLLLSTLISLSLFAASSSITAIDAVRSLGSATAMGVDRAGNLWSWDEDQRIVRRIHPDGTQVERGIAADVRAVDADAELGILVLDRSGRVARVFDWSGRQTAEVALPDESTKICWLDGGEFAVGPRFAPYRAELFSVRSGMMTGRFGPCPAIQPPRAGAVIARATLLRYDFARRELVTFDAYWGELNVFSEKGDVVRHTVVTHPDRGSTEAWIAQMNAGSRANGESFTPTVWSYPTLTLTPDGVIWIGEHADDAGNVTLVRIGRNGSVTRSVVASDCASVRVQAWQGNLFFFRDPRSPRQKCIAVRRL